MLLSSLDATQLKQSLNWKGDALICNESLWVGSIIIIIIIMKSWNSYNIQLEYIPKFIANSWEQSWDYEKLFRFYVIFLQKNVACYIPNESWYWILVLNVFII